MFYWRVSELLLSYLHAVLIPVHISLVAIRETLSIMLNSRELPPPPKQYFNYEQIRRRQFRFNSKQASKNSKISS